MSKKVSDLFIDIYQNFNVVNQVEKMKQLSRKELILLLILSTDSYNYDDLVVMENYKSFGEELRVIHDSLPDSSTDDFKASDVDMFELAEETGDKFIGVEKLVNSKGEKLPPPLSSEEAIIKRREIGIDEIIDNQ